MKNDKSWENIHNECLTWSKWMALYEAVNLISDKAQEKGIPFECVELKPLAIHKYMEMTENLFLRQILKQEHGIDICYDEKYKDLSMSKKKDVEYIC
jgi:hypothetical protein